MRPIYINSEKQDSIVASNMSACTWMRRTVSHEMFRDSDPQKKLGDPRDDLMLVKNQGQRATGSSSTTSRHFFLKKFHRQDLQMWLLMGVPVVGF
jgi:hypothetical protein